VGGLLVGASEKLAEVYLGPHIGSGLENWFPYALATLFLLVRPEGLFGERRIERGDEGARCHFSRCCAQRRRPGVGPPPSSARSGPAASIPNRAVAGTLVAVLSRQKFFSSLLLAHRRQREADPPPRLAA
jgi:hypothetical protein